MADDRMKNDDLQRNMGDKDEDQDFGQQSPGRGGQVGQQGGQHSGGRPAGGQSGQFGGQNEREIWRDDDLDTGNARLADRNAAARIAN